MVNTKNNAAKAIPAREELHSEGVREYMARQMEASGYGAVLWGECVRVHELSVCEHVWRPHVQCAWVAPELRWFCERCNSLSGRRGGDWGQDIYSAGGGQGRFSCAADVCRHSRGVGHFGRLFRQCNAGGEGRDSRGTAVALVVSRMAVLRSRQVVLHQAATVTLCIHNIRLF